MTKKTKDESSENKYQDIEDVSELLGFGKFHYIQIWVFLFVMSIAGAISGYDLVFVVSDPPEWGCINEYGEYTSNETERCHANGTACVGGEIVYNTTHENYLHSLPVQYNWVCAKALWGTNILTASGIGGMFISLVFAHLADRFGRKKIMLLALLNFLLIRLISIHVTQNYIAFLILTGAYSLHYISLGWILVIEYCNEEGRRHAFISGYLGWISGMVIVGFLGIFIMNLTSLVYIVFLNFICDSITVLYICLYSKN